MSGSRVCCGEVPHHNIDLKFTPSMLLNLKGWRCDLSLRDWEGGVQIEDCLRNVFNEWRRFQSGLCNTGGHACMHRMHKSDDHLLHNVADVFVVDATEIEIPLVRLRLCCLHAWTLSMSGLHTDEKLEQDFSMKT